MSPEQREGARAKLGELQLSARTPEDLEQVANAYLMLIGLKADELAGIREAAAP